MRSGGLKRTILLPFACLIAAGFLSGWLVYLRGSRLALRGVMDSLVTETAQHVGDRLAEYLSGAASLAEFNAFSFGAYSTSPSSLSQMRGILRYELLQRDNFDIVAIGFADGEYVEAQRTTDGGVRLGEAGRATGGALVSRPVDGEGRLGSVVLRSPGYDPRRRPWYAAAASSSGVVFTSPYPIVSTGEFAMAAVASYRVDGRLLAVAATDLRLGALSAFLAKIDSVQGGVAAITDAEGRLIASSDSAALAAASKLAEASRVSRLFTLAAARPAGLVFGFDDGSHRFRVVASDRNIGSGLAWRILVALPESRFAAPLRKTDALAVLILMITLVAALIIAFVAAGRVAAPLRELGAALASLEPGSGFAIGPKEESSDSRSRIEVAKRLAKRSDEIGRLAAAFVEMSDRLDESFARLTSSVREKEVLLQEVHHRVKNNLQIVSSMLSLEDGLSTDPAIGRMLERVQDRIQAMAFVHEDVYRSKDFSAVRMDEYLGRICESLAGESSSSCQIEVRSTAGGIELPLERALPCALIVNELVSNAVRHAFTGRDRGRIEVRFSKEGETYLLAVEDDGVGMSESPTAPKESGMGSQLVLGLAQQLNGRVEMRSAPSGTTVELRFPGQGR
jgi:two-component sensor histidine kinase